jgi:hypothetical protein
MKVSDQLNAPATLPPEEELLRYLLDRRLGGHQSRSERCAEEKYLLAVPEIEPCSSAAQPVAIIVAYSGNHMNLIRHVVHIVTTVLQKVKEIKKPVFVTTYYHAQKNRS